MLKKAGHKTNRQESGLFDSVSLQDDAYCNPIKDTTTAKSATPSIRAAAIIIAV